MSLQYHYIYGRDQYSNTGNSNNFLKSWIGSNTRGEYCINSLDRGIVNMSVFSYIFLCQYPFKVSMIIYFESWLCFNFCWSSNSLVLFFDTVMRKAVTQFKLQYIILYMCTYVYIYTLSSRLPIRYYIHLVQHEDGEQIIAVQVRQIKY